MRGAMDEYQIRAEALRIASEHREGVAETIARA